MLKCFMSAAALVCAPTNHQPENVFPWHLVAFHPSPDGQYGYWERTGDDFSEARECFEEVGQNPQLDCVRDVVYV